MEDEQAWEKSRGECTERKPLNSGLPPRLNLRVDSSLEPLQKFKFVSHNAFQQLRIQKPLVEHPFNEFTRNSSICNWSTSQTKVLSEQIIVPTQGSRLWAQLNGLFNPPSYDTLVTSS